MTKYHITFQIFNKGNLVQIGDFTFNAIDMTLKTVKEIQSSALELVCKNNETAIGGTVYITNMIKLDKEMDND